jgi:CheY-like chemotaxis protein
LLFEVSDTGVGIPKTELSSLFESFKQVENQSTNVQKGTGLGLAIADRLASMMDGRIEVESTPGEGSSFTFTARFPVATGPATTGAGEDPRDKEHTEHPPAGSLSILVAEDEKVNQLYLRRFLETQGHAVQVANDGKEAVEQFRRNSFDVIFMDIQMPVMNGPKAIEQIRTFERENSLEPTPVVALTAYALTDDKQRMLNLGADNYLTKPIKEKELEVILSGYLPGSPAADPAVTHMEKTLGTLYIDRLRNEYRGDEKKLAALIDIVLTDLPQRSEELKQSSAEGDFEAAGKAIHSITNISGTIKHKQLLHHSQKLEETIRRDRLFDQELVDTIDRLTKQIVEELKTTF